MHWRLIRSREQMSLNTVHHDMWTEDFSLGMLLRCAMSHPPFYFFRYYRWRWGPMIQLVIPHLREMTKTAFKNFALRVKGFGRVSCQVDSRLLLTLALMELLCGIQGEAV